MEKIFKYVDEKIQEIQNEINSTLDNMDQSVKEHRSSEIYLILVFLNNYMYDLRTTEDELDKIMGYMKQLEELKDNYS